jgi:hypothetical protein
VVASGGAATWELDTIPNAPDVVPSTKVRYMLTQNEDGTFMWEAMTKFTVADCSTDPETLYDVFGVPQSP